MKKTMKKVFFILSISLFSQLSVAAVTLNHLKGSWLGTMHIPDGPSLRIGIEVFKKADNQWGGNIASLDQGNRYMLVSDVQLDNDIFTLQMANAPVSVSGKVNNSQHIAAKFKQGNSEFELNLQKVDVLPEVIRKQTPTNSDAYIQQEVVYQNAKDGTWLSGTLTLPQGSARHPAVMLVAGSGPNHRDSYHAGHRTFKVIADHLTKIGFAVLRSDKRGVYKSGGDFKDANLQNLASDTQAAIQFLKSHHRIDHKNIVLIGHSEGSLVSVMASEQESVQGIVSLAGPGMSVLDILLLQDQTEPGAKGATKAETDILLNFSKRFYNMVLTTPSSKSRNEKAIALYENLSGDEAIVVDKWVNKQNGTLSISSAESESFYTFLQQDPLPYWNKFTGKVLVLNGDKDSQVPSAENVAGIVSAIIHPKAAVESHILEDLNHLFQPAITGAADEYKEIEQTIDGSVLSLISQWLQEHFSTSS